MMVAQNGGVFFRETRGRNTGGDVKYTLPIH